MSQKDIIQELSDLGSSLSTSEKRNPYSVPAGYFDGFAARLMDRLKEAGEATEPAWSRENVYQVPEGYFDTFSANMLQQIKALPDHQNSQEEIEALSPLLSSLKNRPVFSVPEHYFETLNPAIPAQEAAPAKVVSISRRKWFSLAAAAVVIGFISIIGFKMLNKQPDAIKDPAGWVKAKVINKVDSATVDNFVALAKETTAAETENTATAHADVKELIKDIPQNEINKFLDETNSSEDSDDLETLLN